MPSKPKSDQPRRSDVSTPSESAEPYQHPSDHSWNLQMLVDLKGSIGEIKEALRNLDKRTEAHGTKLDSISHQIYAAWAVLVVITMVGGFLLNKFWTVIVKIVEKGIS